MAEPSGVQQVVVMGVSGVGKTTVAKGLSTILGWTFAEGDAFHPEANVEKMASGQSLTDDDRWSWLRSIVDWMSDEIAAGRSGVVTCSALKRVYRDLLREGRPEVVFCHLTADPDLIGERMSHRIDHYMPASLLPSQLDTLEPLALDEPGAAVSADGEAAEVITRALAALGVDDVQPTRVASTRPVYGAGSPHRGRLLVESPARHDGLMTSIEVSGPPVDRSEEVLTPEALAFVADLQRHFGLRRDELLAARRTRQERIAAGERPGFLESTVEIRNGDWQVAPAPRDLRDRRVEITGPTSRKMAINALNSGARVWLADLEDANTPHWRNVVEGQVNLYDAVRRTIAFTSPEGKGYRLLDPDHLPVILPRPRGWHLEEAHLTLDGQPLVGGLVDFGLYFFHNAAEQLSRGSGPYFYLPKMESHLEARLWNDVFCWSQQQLGIPQGSVRATVLIETITAAFEMEEILWELRDHVSGLNAGRWDYLFSIIKNFRDAEGFTLPDRSAITMRAPMMQAYSDLLVATCHKRGAFAMGGMAAFIPSRRDAAVNEAAFAKVRDDKTREADAGFDGSWVAHPDLVPVCAEIFDGVLDGDNQVARRRDDVHVRADDLLAADETPGERTTDGLRLNINVGIAYVAAWLAGNGAAAIHNLMEDAATAEISRSQIWQWTHHAATLASGETVTRELVESIVAEEHAALREAGWYADHLDTARRVFVETALDDEFVDFLTLPAYAAVLDAGE